MPPIVLKVLHFPILDFDNTAALNTAKRAIVRDSLEVDNEEAILGDIDLPSTEEIKQRVYGFYAAQNRAVTIEDYKALVYAMPPSFGAVKRCSMERDFNAFKRNLNLYVISQNPGGFLSETTSTIKQNLKTWLTQYKVINDTVDILDARVVNFGIEFVIVSDYSENKFTALSEATTSLRNYFLNNMYDIAEPIYITDIYKELQKIPNVIDVLDVRIVQKQGGVYSSTIFDFDAHLTANGRSILGDINTVFEIKYPNIDIQGSVV